MAHTFYDAIGTLPRSTTGTRLRTYLQMGDHLGSTAFTIDRDTSELVERTSYQAAGALESDYRPERWAAFREPYKFTGKEEDIEVGLQYFGARYFQPHLGRWLSPDPLAIHGLGGDLNPYAYVRGRVSSLTDPTGLEDSSGGTPDTERKSSSDDLSDEEREAIGDPRYAMEVTVIVGPADSPADPTGNEILDFMNFAAEFNRQVDDKVHWDGPGVVFNRGGDWVAENIREKYGYTRVHGGSRDEPPSGFLDQINLMAAMFPGGGEFEAAPVNGNSLSSLRPQHVYEITRTEVESGAVSTYKYGISGGKETQGGMSARGESQARALTRDAQGTASFESTIVGRIPGQVGGRGQALAAERLLVYNHLSLFGIRPAGNLRP